MKQINSFFRLFFSLIAYLVIFISDAAAQQSSFQIAPSPIAYPYFEDGRADGTIGLSYVSINTDDMNMSGLTGEFKGRMAFSEYTAIDCDLGLDMMVGSMPGMPPIFPIYASNGNAYGISVVDDADLTFIAFRMSFNFEFQPIHSDYGDLILFFGPNISFSQFDIENPFYLIVPFGYANTGEVLYPGHTNYISISTNMTGLQYGIQLNIPLGNNIRLSPFFMYSSFSGTSTVSDKTTIAINDEKTFDFDVPETTSTSIGIDIIFGDLSLGTVLQQMTNSDSMSQDASVIMISISYHFSSGNNESPINNEKAIE